MTGAEIARRSCELQGIPVTVTDDQALDDLAALIVASTGQASRTVPTRDPDAGGRRETAA